MASPGNYPENYFPLAQHGLTEALQFSQCILINIVRRTEAGTSRRQEFDGGICAPLDIEPVSNPDALLDRVWSSESETSRDLVKVYINKLRSKIDTEGEPSLIGNMHGLGYIFDPSQPDEKPVG